MTTTEQFEVEDIFGFNANTSVTAGHAAKLVPGHKIDETSVAGSRSEGVIVDTNDAADTRHVTVGLLIGPARKKVITGGAYADLDPLAVTAAGKYALATAGQWVVAVALELSGGADEERLVLLLPPAQYRLTSAVAASADIVVLTDNSAGVANNTIEALPNPTDTPATADALRDDLVAVLIPALRNNIADLTAKINAILAVLDANGLTL